MMPPGSYLNNACTRLVVGRVVNGPGVHLPDSNATVRIVRGRNGHLGLEVVAPPSVKILREELGQ